MRGEQYYLLPPVGYDEGSPPHARGAVVHYEPLPLVRGITPACAGSSITAHRHRGPGRDHPRMRGEQGVFEPDKKPLQGSPPHTRGAVTPVVVLYFRRSGITPAYAGSRRIHLKPRHNFPGSPPHTRGAVNHRPSFPF